MSAINLLPPTLDIFGLAGLLHCHPTSIRNDLYLRPERVPAPLPRCRRQKLLWDTAKVLEWLRGDKSTDTTKPAKRVGAPTKRERITKAQQAGGAA